MDIRIPVYVIVPKDGALSTREKIFVHPDYGIDVILNTVKNKYPNFKTIRWKHLTIINHNGIDG